MTGAERGAGRAGGAGYNATVDLLERNLEEGRGDRPYLTTSERSWSYGETVEAADAAGAGLLDLGLGAGDRVILAAQDRAEFVVTFWGAMKAGLVPVPVATALSAADLHFVLSDSGARAIVFDRATARAAVPAAQRAGVTALGADVSVDGTRSWSEVCGGSAALDPAPTSGNDIALWLYTSGTTGLPKAVMHRHRHLRDAPGALSAQVLQTEADDVVLSISKMYFAYGLGNSVYLPAAFGASVVLNEAPVVPSVVHELLEKAKPTLLFGVPAFFAGFAGLADATLPGSVRRIVSAGEALSSELFQRFRERFGLPLLDGLGATEALHHVTSNRPDDAVAGSAGRPLTGYEVQVLDRDQEPVADGESGELWVRGPTTFAGYWRRPELTARAYRGDWMRTGDLVRVEDGRVYHLGRLDDLIKLGGIWVAPTEIEDVLRGHRDVTDAAVVPLDDGSGVPVLKAFVLSDREERGLSKELSRLCRGRLAAFKVPRSFEVVEELPRTPTGKLKRFVLRGGENGRDGES